MAHYDKFRKLPNGWLTDGVIMWDPALNSVGDNETDQITKTKANINPDNVNHPLHYTEHPSGVECIEITEHMSFCIGNAFKYLWRYDLKNGVEDLEKAKWYIDREIKRLENGED